MLMLQKRTIFGRVGFYLDQLLGHFGQLREHLPVRVFHFQRPFVGHFGLSLTCREGCLELVNFLVRKVVCSIFTMSGGLHQLCDICRGEPSK